MSPPEGYELSIYGSVSIAFWISTAIAFSLFSLGLYRAACDHRNLQIGLHLSGLTIANLVLVALPLMRYRTYYTEWDVWFHLGQTANITLTGHIDLTTNVYPGLHILWSAISNLTGISVFDTGILLGLPLEGIRVPLLFLLTRRASKSAQVAALAASLAALPDGIVGTFPAAWYFALALLPLVVLLLLLRLQVPSFGSTMLVLVTAGAFVISHPLGPLFLIAAVVIQVFWSARAVLRRARVAAPPEGLRRKQRALLGLTALISILFLTWIALLTAVLEVSVGKIADAFASAGVINPAQYGKFLTFTLVGRVFGGYAIIGAYWLAGLLVLHRARPTQEGTGMYMAAALTLSGLLLGVVFELVASQSFLGDFFQRPFDVVMLFVPVIAATFLQEVHNRLSRRTWGNLAMAAAYLIPFALIVAAMFPSPYVALYNYQNTQEVYSAVGWTAASLPAKSTVLSNSYVGRYAYYGLHAIGPQYADLYHSLDNLPSNDSEMAALVGTGTYVILDQETILVAGANLRDWSFPGPSDVVTFRGMVGIATIYDNGETQVYLAQS